DGVLAWVEHTSGPNGVLRVMDLGDAEPQPVDVAQARRDPGVRAVELRGGRLAWVSSQDRGLRLASSPITRVPAVRAVGRTVTGALSPNRDTVMDTWTLHELTTAPVDSLTFTVRASSGAVVRTFTGAAPLGR